MQNDTLFNVYHSNQDRSKFNLPCLQVPVSALNDKKLPSAFTLPYLISLDNISELLTWLFPDVKEMKVMVCSERGMELPPFDIHVTYYNLFRFPWLYLPNNIHDQMIRGRGEIHESVKFDYLYKVLLSLPD